MSLKTFLSKKAVWIPLAVVLVAGGVAATAVRVVDAHLPHYRQALAERISDRLDATLTIDNLDLSWSWHGPILHLGGVRLSTNGDQGTTLHVPALSLQFSLLELAQGSRLPTGVTLHAPRFAFTLGAPNKAEPLRSSGSQTSLIDWSLVARIRAVLDYVAIDNARIAVTVMTGGKARTLKLRPFDASVRGSGDTLELSVHTQVGAGLGAVRINARITGALPNFKRAHVSVDVNNLATVALWQQLAPDTVPDTLSGGQTDLSLTASWQARQFQHAKLELDTTAVRSTQLDTAVLPALQARLSAQPAATAANIIHISLASLSGARAALANISASARVDTADLALTLHTRHIAATLFAPLLQLQFPALGETQLSGAIRAAQLTLSSDDATRAAVQFDHIAVTAPQFAAGPISAHYYHNGDSNVLRFSDAGGRVRIAHYVRGAVPLQDLSGQLSWDTSADGLQLLASDLRVSTKAARMTLNGTLSIPHDAAVRADLQAHLATSDASIPLSHVPQTTDMPFDRLRDWLPKAIISGQATVDAYLKGPLKRMFAEDGKHLGISITGSDFALEYKPGWPRLTHATGTVKLRGDTLAVAIDKGQILGVNIGAVTIDVDNVREPVLFLDGTIDSGPAARMLSFLAKSPLQERFGKLVAALDVDGNAGLDLQLRLPLKDDLGELKVSGVIHAQGNRINHDALPAPIEAIRGDIHFSKAGLRANKLQGQLLGVALTTQITPAGDQRINITSRGRVKLPQNTELLAHYLPKPWLDLAHGSAMTTVTLQLNTSGDISGLSLHSDLQGMALELPAPLHKTAGTQVPLQLAINKGGQLALTYGDSVRVNMTFVEHKLRRAIIRLGQPRSVQPPAGPGLWLGGHTPTLPVRRWLQTLAQLSPDDTSTPPRTHSGADTQDKPQATTTDLPFLGANLRIDALRLGPRQVRQVHLQVVPMADVAGWKIAVSGPNAKGNATWRPTTNSHGMLRAHFDRLYIEPVTTPTQTNDGTNKQPPDAVLTDFDPRRLPAVDVSIERLHIASTAFGSATVKATRIDNGWKLHQATLTDGALAVEASGAWTRHVGLTQARLDVNIQGHGFARLLQTLGYDPAIRAQQVALQASLRFAPSDRGLDLAALNGTLSVRLDDGMITSIEPGAGRLLGLLNLYALPRRLMLDFSDVLGEGLAFDTIHGDFKIISGDAFTDNLTIETPAVTIHIVGRVGLATRTYDQTVTLVPQFGSSLTLAGAVLGGPVIGAAIFALQQVLETPIENASSITYQVQGSWGDPKIVNPRAKE